MTENALQLKDILTLSRTCFRANVSSKKKALELISNVISHETPQLQSNDIFDALIERERLGSTGIGHGCAIPHCRLSSTDQAIAVLILLKEPVSYDSLDKQPVDLIFALIVPEDTEEDYLQLVASIAEKLSSSEFRDQLRHTEKREVLFEQALS